VAAWLNTAADAPAVLTWDAPLRLDPAEPEGARNYASRQIDAAVRTWLASRAPPEQGRAMGPSIAKGAVGVTHASGCPHNLLTQHVWGLPVGDAPAHGTKLLLPGQRAGTRLPRRVLAEVHPAVTLAAWWMASGGTAAMPRYKRKSGIGATGAREGLETVLDFLGTLFRHEVPTCQIREDDHGQPDDRLDAWVAWRMAFDWTEGRAQALRPPGGGSYLLPTTLRWDGGVAEVTP
jgi:hypothetical protein